MQGDCCDEDNGETGERSRAGREEVGQGGCRAGTQGRREVRCQARAHGPTRDGGEEGERSQARQPDEERRRPQADRYARRIEEARCSPGRRRSRQEGGGAGRRRQAGPPANAIGRRQAPGARGGGVLDGFPPASQHAYSCPPRARTHNDPNDFFCQEQGERQGAGGVRRTGSDAGADIALR